MTSLNLIDQPEEILDIVNEKDEVIGTEKKEIANKNPQLIHREVGVIIFDLDNKILLQKRSPKKSTNPGRWTVSSAGHVTSGETYEEAAYRELLEELGFDTKLRLALIFLENIPGKKL